MKIQLLLALVTLFSSIKCVAADFPKIASLRAGEQIMVTMRLYGYTITGADFLFTPEKVTVVPLNKKQGELVLTAEEKARVDEYLKLIRLGVRRKPGEEGFEYSIKYFKDQQQIGTWSYSIYDAQESSKSKLSLYELKDRVEKLQNQKVERIGVGQPVTKPADKVPAKVKP